MNDAVLFDRTHSCVAREPSGDRRQPAERRVRYDRRGDPWARTVSKEPRPYGFRAFTDRRCGLDRRMYGVWAPDTLDVELSPEEILALFHDPKSGDR